MDGGQEEAYRKVFVEVVVRHLTDGSKIPLSITFEDGKRYPIDRLCDTRRAACTKVGGTGIRYTIAVSGRRTHLFEDENLWWVEARNRHI